MKIHLTILCIIFISLVKQIPATFTYWRSLRQSKPDSPRAANGDARRSIGSQKNGIIENSGLNMSIVCPLECLCQGLSIDCSSKGLKYVPKNIPSNRIKMYSRIFFV